MVKIYDSIWNKHRLRQVATGVGLVLAGIGVAGIPEDIRMWAMWLENIGSVLDLWVVRAGLASVGLALVTYPQWLPRARKVLSRPNSADTPEVNWQEAEDRFGFIDGELDTIWTEYDDGLVEWRIKPVVQIRMADVRSGSSLKLDGWGVSSRGATCRGYSRMLCLTI